MANLIKNSKPYDVESSIATHSKNEHNHSEKNDLSNQIVELARTSTSSEREIDISTKPRLYLYLRRIYMSTYIFLRTHLKNEMFKGVLRLIFYPLLIIKLLWTFALTLSYGLSFYLIIMSIFDYLEYGVHTKVRTIFETPTYFPKVNTFFGS